MVTKCKQKNMNLSLTSMFYFHRSCYIKYFVVEQSVEYLYSGINTLSPLYAMIEKQCITVLQDCTKKQLIKRELRNSNLQ